MLDLLLEGKGCECAAIVLTVLSAICPVYSTCLSHSEALCALHPGLEGRVQLFRNVSDLLGWSVNAAVVGQHTK